MRPVGSDLLTSSKRTRKEPGVRFRLRAERRQPRQQFTGDMAGLATRTSRCHDIRARRLHRTYHLAPHGSPPAAKFCGGVCFDRVAMPLGSGATRVVELLTALGVVESAKLWKRRRAKGLSRTGRVDSARLCISRCSRCRLCIDFVIFEKSSMSRFTEHQITPNCQSARTKPLRPVSTASGEAMWTGFCADAQREATACRCGPEIAIKPRRSVCPGRRHCFCRRTDFPQCHSVGHPLS
jgi:hypothetical protein